MIPSMIHVPDLDHQEQNTLDKLMRQLAAKWPRNQLRTQYYDRKSFFKSLGIAVPPNLEMLDAVLGWPAKAVDVLARRIHLEGFVLPGGDVDSLGIPAMWRDNRMRVEVPQATTSALLHSCAFVATTTGDTAAGEPEILITTLAADVSTGLWDPRRRCLSAGLGILDMDDAGRPTEIVMLTPDKVITLRKAGDAWTVERRPHPLERVPMEPLVYQPRLGRPFGSSRITRAVMSISDSALRTVVRSEVMAEFFSAPQRYALGVREEWFVDAEGKPKGQWAAIMGRVWGIPRDEDGELPEIGQFPQISMQPHVEHLRMWATLFAGETSLPVSSLGVVQDNPSSAEAIYAAKEELVIEAEYAIDVFDDAWCRSILTGIQLRDGLDEIPAELTKLAGRWRDPSTPSRAAASDAVTKEVGAGILPPDSEVAYERLGYDQTTIDRLVSERRRNEARRRVSELAAAARAARETPGVAEMNEPAEGGGEGGDGG